MIGKFVFFLMTILFLFPFSSTQIHAAQADDFIESLQGGLSSNCPSPDLYSSQRPDPQGTTTPVMVSIAYNDILEIDDAEQTFTVDAWIILRWKDARLADPARGKAPAMCETEEDQLWTPRIQIRDLRGLQTHYSDVHLIDSEGMITLFRRGMIRVFTQFDLKDFPFDKQNLLLIIDSLYGINDVEFQAWEDTISQRKPTVPGWILSEPSASVNTEKGKLLTRSIYKVDVEAKREGGIFTRKLILPVALIVFMAYAIFWISPTQIAPQTGIGATSMLTLIAYQFALSGSLPRISYLTRADSFLLFALVLVFTALAEAIATAGLMNYGKESIVRKMDWFFRFFYPLAFLWILIQSAT